MSSLKIVQIQKIVEETAILKTFYFHDEMAKNVTPGQFIMVWVPGIDEIPMGLSEIGPNYTLGFTVERVGDATEALHNLRQGALIGVRGPYGRGFKIRGKKVLVVAGGNGLSPLKPLIEKLIERKIEITVVAGSKGIYKIPFLPYLMEKSKKHNFKLIITTEDGSMGIKGLVTEPLRELINSESFDQIYTCGPELMMYNVFKIAQDAKIPIQASLERFMKCGIGICGSCCLNEFIVCKDGPVFTEKELSKMHDFGKFKMDSCGVRVKVQK
ncbi:MAG: dihydroorotate dehydrogenase electron transfer subunit [Candidatus Odinarchaeia archaeon]